MIKFIRKYYCEILSILIPIIILLISCFISRVYPFGNFTLAKYDGYYQYPGFTTYFRSVLLNQNSLLYTFKGLLGYNFYTTAIYYMFNYSNLLCVFFSKSNLLEYYTLLIFLRIVASGFTMCKYLKYKFKENNFMIVLFSSCYALMGYNVCYFFNYMYFDVIVLFPLVIMGLEKLVYENKCSMYIITLTLSIISNFYIGYMVCIFSLLYFIYSYYLLKKKKKKIIKNFIISSLLSGLISSFILIPVIYELLQGKADFFAVSSQTDYFKFNINFLNIFYKSIAGTFSYKDISYGSVNSYVSLFVITLVIQFFFNKKIDKKEKIATIIFILFFILSISFNLIDYAWQMFQKPIWYPNRYIFTFSFLLIVIACKSYKYKSNIKINNLTRIIICILFILLTILPLINSNMNSSILKIICYFLGIMMLLQYIFLINNKNAKLLICFLVILELSYNTILTIKELNNSITITSYKSQNNVFEKVISSIPNNNNDFYRTELQESIVYNNGLMYNYNSVNGFNSVKNSKVMNFFNNYFNYTVKDSTNLIFNNYNPYITSILNIKYLSGKNNEYYYNKIYNGEINIYENKDVLSLGYMINKNVNNYNFEENNSIKNTEEIVNTMLGTKENIYIELNNSYYKTKIYNNKIIQENTNESYIKVSGKALYNGFLITDSNSKYYVIAEVKINGKIVDLNNYYMPLYIKKGDKYNIVLKSNYKEYDVRYSKWYILKIDNYNKFINEIKKNMLKITNYKSDSNIEGTITSTNDKNVLFTSIPYDKGWNIYVDNEKVKYNKCYNTFICLNLSEGKHNIKFKYCPPYLIPTLIISFISIIITIIFVKKNNSY